MWRWPPFDKLRRALGCPASEAIRPEVACNNQGHFGLAQSTAAAWDHTTVFSVVYLQAIDKTGGARPMSATKFPEVLCFHCANLQTIENRRGPHPPPPFCASGPLAGCPWSAQNRPLIASEYFDDSRRSFACPTALKSLLMRNSPQVVEILRNLLNLSRSY